MRIIFALLILTLFQQTHCLAQASGEVTYPYLGIKFNIPEGWLGQETEEGYLMASNTEAGLIFMILHEENTLDQLEAQIKSGIDEGNGTTFTLDGDITKDAGMIGAEFTGMLEWNRARAYLVSVLNPFGNGVTVVSLTTPDMYSDRYKQLAYSVARSLKFATPEESKVVKEWKEDLKGAKLTYLSTYDGSGYGSSGGSSTKSEYTLCSDQSFSHYYESSFSVDTGGAFANSASQDGGNGIWEVTQSATGGAILSLSYNDGRKEEYDINDEDGKTYLNSSRYFRTYDHGTCR